VAQLLTPAPTAREITWKRAVFKHGDHKHICAGLARALARSDRHMTARKSRTHRRAS
jgi:hypothetical protein